MKLESFTKKVSHEFPQNHIQSRFLTRPKVQENLFAYLMLAPDLIGLAVFIFLPIVIAFYVSLHDWNALEPMQFVGLKNYWTLSGDLDWWVSLRTTALYSLMFVPLVYGISLLLAVFIHSIPGKFQEFIRTVNFMPFSVSTVVAGIIWMFMFEEQRGMVNGAIKLLGLPAQTFLGDPDQALICIALVSAWMVIGYYTVLFLAALKDIPVSYYEAARLDGANVLTIFKNITLPLLKETSTFVLIVTTIASFQVFDQIKIMTNGGPADATNVSVFYIYRQCFEYMKLGYASALAFVLFMIIFALSLAQLKLMRSGNTDSKI
ncbi:carbohydrate ABC transporter membrane protein 1 (CUT1 family) [Hydrogenispora ethanolica]|uniref:Carbohydrate ABC transporter membrane protein 1 (CUT1 family) n=1 Tax=Hydrogenispora ethanolica TaxID=1082276 RepID=A0A4R1R7B2_HYDET|nr:sugar ABC transporter permease [Hydrogenispora ethanolica]TCL61496.1 carbohydrate ABC transporter membrane protein 1 (CUT1 family) [Hydrogenispora ethanolica]